MANRSIVTTLTLVAILVGVLDAAAGQQPRVDPFPPLSPETAPNPQLSPNQPATMIPVPRVICGMTLIPAPKIDPKIASKKSEKPKDPTKYTIRPVQPSICW